MSDAIKPARRERVVFDLNGEEIEIYEKDGQLFVYSTARLIVNPNASNSIILKMEKI